MYKPKAITCFKDVKDNDLNEKTTTILTKMTNNPDFKNPVPKLTVVQAALQAYLDALAKCPQGTKQDIAIKNNKKALLESELSHLGNYVNSIAEGNLVILDGSGFPISKPHAPIGLLTAPEYLILSPGPNPGEVIMDIAIVPKARGYVGLYASYPPPEDNTQWHSILFTKSKGTVSGLKSGQRYAFKAAAVSTESSSTGKYNFTKTMDTFVL